MMKFLMIEKINLYGSSNYGKVTQKLSYVILIISIIPAVKIFSWENILFTIPALVLVLFYREKKKILLALDQYLFLSLFLLLLYGHGLVQFCRSLSILIKLAYTIQQYYFFIVSITIPFDRETCLMIPKNLKLYHSSLALNLPT